MPDNHLNTPRCRVCGGRVRMRADEMAGKHTADGVTCRGAGLPVAGEPPCLPACRPVGTIGYPVPYEPGRPHASTVICDSPSHRAEASEWVEGITGHAGVFRAYSGAGRPS